MPDTRDWKTHRARIAAARRHRPDDVAYIEAEKAEMVTLRLCDTIAERLSTVPGLTDAQRVRILAAVAEVIA